MLVQDNGRGSPERTTALRLRHSRPRTRRLTADTRHHRGARQGTTLSCTCRTGDSAQGAAMKRALVDDHQVVRDGLKTIIVERHSANSARGHGGRRGPPPHAWISRSSTFHCGSKRVEVGMSSSRFIHRCPCCLSMHSEEQHAVRFRAGNGYITATVRGRIGRGDGEGRGRWRQPAMAERPPPIPTRDRSLTASRLSDREFEVMRLLRWKDGWSNCRAVALSDKTIALPGQNPREDASAMPRLFATSSKIADRINDEQKYRSTARRGRTRLSHGRAVKAPSPPQNDHVYSRQVTQFRIRSRPSRQAWRHRVTVITRHPRPRPGYACITRHHAAVELHQLRGCASLVRVGEHACVVTTEEWSTVEAERHSFVPVQAVADRRWLAIAGAGAR